jgi:hypothetical protein
VLRIHVRSEVRADPALFVALAVDLDRMRALHPRVTAARWLDEPAVPGSRAEIAVAIPPALGLVESIVGAPRGVLTLAEHEPGRRARYLLDADLVAGTVELAASRAEPVVEVSATLWARSTLARAATAPAAGVAQVALERSARRTLERADQTLLRSLRVAPT